MSDSSDNTSDTPLLASARLPRSRVLLIWLLFFLICVGLGYPTLKRYEPTRSEGLSDAIVYRQMVVGPAGPRPIYEVFGGRVLVPYAARIFYYIIGSRVEAVDPITLSLLLAASIFCAATATLLAIIGRQLTRDDAVGLLAATLYLLSFAVPNFQLAGLIDSGESFFMLVLTWCFIARKWWLLPLIGIGGAFAKETFLPFATVFAIVWWFHIERRNAGRLIGWVIAMIVSIAVTLVLIRWALFGRIIWPWQIAAMMNSQTNFVVALWNCISDRSFWYVFLWLLPLGVLGFQKVPRAWLWATVITSLVALLLGAYKNMAGTVARPIFDIAGPMLSLSVAMLISRAHAPGFDQATS
jgi:uncharacterized membrane protein